MKKLLFSFITVAVACTARSQTWNITGNSGTMDNVHFLGTIDNKPLNFRINNQVAGRIDTANVFLGYKAGGQSDGVRMQNVAIGYGALTNNTIGTNNTATGSLTLSYNISGSYNTASGTLSLYRNTTGENKAMIYVCTLEVVKLREIILHFQYQGHYFQN